MLLCAQYSPWTAPSGYQMRLAMVAEALSRFGLVDVCLLDRHRPAALDAPWPPWVGDAEWYPVENRRWWPASAIAEQSAPIPQARLRGKSRDAARTRFFSRSYDLTWCAEPPGYEPVADILSPPVVLDLHDVVSAAVAHKRRALASAWWQPAAWRESLLEPAYFPGAERLWHKWERQAVERCSRVVVCSDLDRARLHGPSVSTIPNCYPRPAHPAGFRNRGDAPLRAGFVGTMQWQPNRDALHWFVTAVWHRIRAVEPDAQLDVIGEKGSRLPAMEREPGVRMLGFVEDIDRQLAEISVLVAPIRFGGGTRFKILEAFAHGIPMVSTVIGAEGIDAVDGEHLLLRDEPAEFARAVVDAHRDGALRQRLLDGGTRLYEARYTWERGLDAVTAVAGELLASGSARRTRHRA